MFVQAIQVKSSPKEGKTNKLVGTKQTNTKISLTLSIILSNQAPVFDFISNNLAIEPSIPSLIPV
jgi:hypothetical protein